MTNKKLNARQQKFVDEYLLDGNAMQSAIRAGYAETTALAKSYLWVGKSRKDCPKTMQHVWDAVQKAKQERSERTKIDADWMLKRLAEEADAELADIYNEEEKH